MQQCAVHGAQSANKTSMTVGCEETDNVVLARVMFLPVHATCISGTTKVQLHPRHHQLAGTRTKSPTCVLRERLASHIFDRHIENANTYCDNSAVFFGKAVCVCIRGRGAARWRSRRTNGNTKKSRLTPTHKGNRVHLAAASYIVVCCIVPVFFKTTCPTDDLRIGLAGTLPCEMRCTSKEVVMCPSAPSVF